MPEMNHRTKGDCMPRDSINDHSITWQKGGSYFMFKLPSLTSGSTQPQGWKVQSAILRQIILRSKCDFPTINNSSLTEALLST